MQDMTGELTLDHDFSTKEFLKFFLLIHRGGIKKYAENGSPESGNGASDTSE